MTTLFTDQIETNSFIGLVSNAQPVKSRRRFVRIESTEVLTNFAIATVVIIMGLAAGSVSQQKMDQAHFASGSTVETVKLA